MTDQPRRRAEDRQAPSQDSPGSKTQEADPKPRRSSRDFFTKFRQPLIGLGLVGASAPLINAGSAEQQEKPASSNAAEQPECRRGSCY